MNVTVVNVFYRAYTGSAHFRKIEFNTTFWFRNHRYDVGAWNIRLSVVEAGFRSFSTVLRACSPNRLPVQIRQQRFSVIVGSSGLPFVGPQVATGTAWSAIQIVHAAGDLPYNNTVPKIFVFHLPDMSMVRDVHGTPSRSY